jgi:hypothetical protein
MTGFLPPDAPATLRMLDPRFQGQLTTAELIGQYDLASAPVRDLLVGYLDERQPSVDYATLKQLACLLGKLFWKDLETHNPGISSLRLAPDTAVAWKQRLSVKTVTTRDEAGNVTQTTAARIDAISCLTAVRAFYLDIAEGPPGTRPLGAVGSPLPVRRDDISPAKQAMRRSPGWTSGPGNGSPCCPPSSPPSARPAARPPTADRRGEPPSPARHFTSGGVTLRRTALISTRGRPHNRIWAEDPVTGTRRDLTRKEDAAFWTWAAVEVLRATGIHLEELTELSHHSLVQYRVPGSGELVPLLHIAPSKSSVGVLVISPELADVLAAASPASAQHRGRHRTTS